MKKHIFTLLILSLFQNYVFGQSNPDTLKLIKFKPKKISAIGANAGTTTGLGLTYLFKNDGLSTQITLLPLIDKLKTTISAGFDVSFTVKSSNKTDVVIYVGNHLTNMFADNYVYNIGIGPGFQVIEGATVIQFMFGYGLYDVIGDIKTRPTIELGILYNFID